MRINYSHQIVKTVLEFITTRVAEHNGVYLAPVLMSGRTIREEKSPIHVADAIKMRKLSFRLERKSGGDISAERQAGRVLAVATSDGVKRLVEDNCVKFDLRENVDVLRNKRPSKEEEEGESNAQG